jgi:hypothetical protein
MRYLFLPLTLLYSLVLIRYPANFSREGKKTPAKAGRKTAIASYA